MSRRIMAGIWFAAALAGCRAGTSFHGSGEIAQWTPGLDATGLSGSASGFDLVGEGGLRNDDAFWSIDVGMQYGYAGRGGLAVQSFNLGYFGHKYEGTAVLEAPRVVFDGVTLSDEIKTTADLKLYRFSYGNPSTAGGAANTRTEGLLGLHYLEFDIKCIDVDDPSTMATFSGNAPMFVIGWQIAQIDRSIIYYFRVEGMDLDAVSLGNVKGTVVDYVAGVRWTIAGNSALTLGWRSYECDINKRGEKLNFKMEGAYFSFFFMW